ncbi:hypothetical protein DRH14_01345 [Candidatus Shapirobacteria bacterium]|nr:MAG: hypothetical protein DRH14_01345 [Candidatus Shapirobacteria bacterium]
MQNKKNIVGGVILVVVILFAFLVFQSKRSKNISVAKKKEGPAKCVLYYGSTCPHCKIVEKWLEENEKIKDKSGIVLKEIYQNRDNLTEMSDRAKECGVATKGGIGVPFLYDHGKCLMGDQPIIDYFKENYKE